MSGWFGIIILGYVVALGIFCHGLKDMLRANGCRVSWVPSLTFRDMNSLDELIRREQDPRRRTLFRRLRFVVYLGLLAIPIIAASIYYFVR